MRYFRVIPVIIYVLVSSQSSAQVVSDERSRTSVFNAFNFQSIFGNLDQDFQGIFGHDTPESEFRVKFTQFRLFHPNNFAEVEGLNWHKNQITPFKGLLEIFQVNGQDSAPKPYKNDSLYNSNEVLFDSLNKTGWQLYQALGGLDFLEDSTRLYSGHFRGIFKLCFFYNEKLNMVSAVPENLALTEVGMIYTGYWSPYGENRVYSPFFWSNLSPVLSPAGSKVLPDLRLNEEGKPNSEVLIELSESLNMAPPLWWVSDHK